VSYGTNHTEVAVYDTSLTAIPGSPIDVTEGQAIPSINDEMGVIAIGTPSGLRGYHRSTLTKIGSTGLASLPSQVIDVGYIPPSTLIATMLDGTVARVSATDMSILTAPVSVSSNPVGSPVYDANSNHLFVLSSDTLYELNPTTLATISSKTFPTYVSGIIPRY
jgi:hypothetical protein